MEDIQTASNYVAIKEAYTPYIASFIDRHADDINANKFSELYEILATEEIFHFTELLLLSDIDPLPYMKTVPLAYLFDSKHIPNVIVGSNIHTIEEQAFARSNITRVVIDESVTEIKLKAFAQMKNEVLIEYTGTLEQWNSIRKAANIFEKTTATISCLDQTIEIMPGQ